MADEIKDSLISEMFENGAVSINASIENMSNSRKGTSLIDKKVESTPRKGVGRTIEQIAANNLKIFERAAREMAELERGPNTKEEIDINRSSNRNTNELSDREEDK